MTHHPSTEVELRHAGFTCLIRPALGGSLWSFSRDGLPVLRDQSACGTGAVTDSACFPLVPFSNRLRDRAFAFDGRTYHLPANVPGADRVAHGFGWQAEWRIVRRDTASVTLEHAHSEAPGWPWAYRAAQHVSLGPEGLSVDLSVTNRATSPMPAGLGLHPYFPRSGDERLELYPEVVRKPDADGFPAAEDASLKQGWSVPNSGAGPATAYVEGWVGPALIHRPGGPKIRLSASGNARHLILYAPAGEDYFCVEPVTHPVGALNDPSLSGLVILDPGETARLTMTISD